MRRSVPIVMLQGIALALALSAGLHVAINGMTALSKGQPLEPLALLAGTVPADLGLSVAIVVAWLAGELALVGWARSSLRKLSSGAFAASRSDTVMTAIALMGIHGSVAALFSGGLSSAWLGFLGERAPFGLLREAPLWLAVPVLFLGASFTNYWVHRLMHTRAFWTLHAIHHAPTEFTVLTGTYASVIEAVCIMTAQALTFALIGGSEQALYWAGLIAGMEPHWSHSHIRGVEWLERFGINSPKAHTIHHAIDERYHNRNFGDSVILWDRLFGTYTPSSAIDGDLQLGVRDPRGIFNTGHVLRDWLMPQKQWFIDGFQGAAHGLRRRPAIAG